MSHPVLQAPGFREEIAKLATLREVAGLLAIPALLLLVFLLPPSVRAGLAYRPGSASLLTAFTAHYVHLTAGHLAGNLAVYLTAVGLGYPLALLGGVRRLYLALVAAILLAFPFVLSGLHVMLLGGSGFLGFSGLAIAIVGLLPLVLVAYLRARVAGAVSMNDAPALFFFVVAGIAWQTAAAVPAADRIAALSAAVGVLNLVPLAVRVRRHGPQTGPNGLGRGYLELPLAVAALFVLFPTIGFPIAASVPATASIDFLVHLLAYALGFLGAYLTERTVRAFGPLTPTAPPPPPPQ